MYDFFKDMTAELDDAVTRSINPEPSYRPPAPATKKEDDTTNGFFGFLDSALDSSTDFLGNVVDKIENSKIADAYFNHDNNISTPEKQTDLNGSDPASALSGTSVGTYISDNKLLVAGGGVAFIALVLLLKKI